MLRKLLPVALFLLLAYPLFFHRLAARDLWSSHEARAGENARMMLESGQWLLPHLLDGKPELQKPPLYYWLVAGLGWLHGEVDAWAIRLPSALSALGCVFAVWFFLARSGRPVAGLLAGLVLGTMVHFTWMGRVGRIDMPLSLSILLILSGYFLGQRRLIAGQPGAWQWFLLAYVAAAGAILLKGPVGAVLAGGVIVVHVTTSHTAALRAAARRPLRVLHQYGACWGVPLVLILVLPWFLYANHETHGEFFRTFFLRHNLQRGLGGDDQFDTHFHPWWYYAYRLAVDLQPWSLLLPVVGYFLIRRGLWRSDTEARFGCIWLATMTLLLSLLDYKRADYLLPAYAGAAILLGCVGERVIGELRSGWLGAARFGLATLVSVCGIGWVAYVDVFLPRGEASREQRSFANAVRHYASRYGMVILFRVESHPLTFHLGRPWDRILEWENLDIWACQPAPIYVVMPAAEVADWPDHLEAGRLYPVLTNSELAGTAHEQPLVLLCTRPPETYNEGVVAWAGRQVSAPAK